MVNIDPKTMQAIWDFAAKQERERLEFLRDLKLEAAFITPTPNQASKPASVPTAPKAATTTHKVKRGAHRAARAPNIGPALNEMLASGATFTATEVATRTGAKMASIKVALSKLKTAGKATQDGNLWRGVAPVGNGTAAAGGTGAPWMPTETNAA